MSLSNQAIRQVGSSVGVATAVTSNLAIASTVDYGAYSNIGATADVTITLPSATIGRRFAVLKEVRSYNLSVDCQFSDRFEDQTNGVDVALVDNGFAIFECLRSGVWSIVSRRGLQHPLYHDNHRQIYLATTGSDSNDGLSVGNPKLTVKGIAAIARPGDVVNVAAGTYSGSDNEFTEATLPIGTQDDHIKFTCSTAFGARFQTFVVNFPSYQFADRYKFYVDFENLVWLGASTKRVRGQQMRFFRCAFLNGVTTTDSNESVLSVGASDQYAWDTSDILFQDCVMFGSGGRYRALAYAAKRIIFRRCVARWDQGWDSSGSWQAADFGLYDSSECEMQNCISIDDLAPATSPGTYKGAFFFEQNYYEARDLAMRGCIVVNNQGPAFAANGLTSNPAAVPAGIISSTNVWRKMRAQNWLVQDFAAAKVLHPSAHTLNAIDLGLGPITIESFTIADLNRAAAAGVAVGYASAYPRWMDGSRISNGVTAYGAAGGAAHVQSCTGVTTSNNLTYANIAAANTAGLNYLPLADYSSTIHTAGSGAEILKKIGRDGTMYGEPGFRSVGDGATSGDLWPWPYETEIKALFVEFGGTARGWTAVGSSLTQYIWGMLGTAGPP